MLEKGEVPPKQIMILNKVVLDINLLFIIYCKIKIDVKFFLL